MFCNSIFNGGVSLSTLQDLFKRAKLRHMVCLVYFLRDAFADIGNRHWYPFLDRHLAFGVGAARYFEDCFNIHKCHGFFCNHPNYLRPTLRPCAVFAPRADTLLVLFYLVAWRPWMNAPRMPNGIEPTVGFSIGFGGGKRKRQSRRLFPVGLTLPLVGEGPCGLLDIWLRPCNYFVCRLKIQ